MRLRLPESLRHIGASGEGLTQRFIANLREFAEVVKERCGKYTEKMTESATAGDFKKAGYWQRMREDYMGQFLVNQLSNRGLIPTYSFPVHSLSLEVTQERQQKGHGWGGTDVALSRDASQGISEYPSLSHTVAGLDESAQKSLYFISSKGGDKICIYKPNSNHKPEFTVS